MKNSLIVAILSVISVVSCATTLKPVEGTETRQASVRITNGQGGGTGSIYRSYSTHSLILTNNHVCEVVKSGGFVITNDGKEYPVVSYRPSKVHDLCLLKVKEDLGVNTQVASKAPKLGTKATISGHPKLQPHTRTVGDFGDYLNIKVVVGMEPCTEKDLEDIKDPLEGLICLLGGKPIIKEYETQYISAMIAPGSSGSAVYDEDGNIAAVVFAGQGRDYGFAYTVPWEYVDSFLNFEVRGVPPVVPNVRSTAENESLGNDYSIFPAIYFYDEEISKLDKQTKLERLYKKVVTKLQEGNVCLEQELLTP